jgi:tol-pal system protein YbgF
VSISVSVKNVIAKAGLFIFIVLLFSSCTTMEQDILYLNDQVVALNSRADKLNSRADKLNSRADKLRESQAEAGVEIDKMREEIQGLSGRAEDNRLLVKRAVERDTTEQDVINTRLTDLNQRIGELNLVVKKLHEYLRLEPPKVLTKQDQRISPTETRVPIQPPQDVEGMLVSGEKNLYEQTLKKYHEEKYEKAIIGFKGFLKDYPKSDLADNAQFWIGECYMAMKQYEQAVLAYQEVIKKYPKGNKVPNAMLRQALAFYEIKDKISSKLLLKKIIKKYPNSSEAKIAKIKLKIFK